MEGNHNMDLPIKVIPHPKADFGKYEKIERDLTKEQKIALMKKAALQLKNKK